MTEPPERVLSWLLRVFATGDMRSPLVVQGGARRLSVKNRFQGSNAVRPRDAPGSILRGTDLPVLLLTRRWVAYKDAPLHICPPVCRIG